MSRIGISRYRDEILVEERQIMAHATGLAETWRAVGTYAGSMTEKLSSVYSLQQQSSTASLWQLLFIEDIGITYRYSRYTWKNRVFLPVRDAKTWGPSFNPGIEILLEEQTNYTEQIQSNPVPSIFPPEVELFPQHRIIECTGATFYSMVPPIYGTEDDIKVSVDGSMTKSILIVDGGATLAFSPAPPNGAVAEVLYNSTGL